MYQQKKKYSHQWLKFRGWIMRNWNANIQCISWRLLINVMYGRCFHLGVHLRRPSIRKPLNLMASSSSSFDFLSLKPYTPPSWASHLQPLPSHVFSLAHVCINCNHKPSNLSIYLFDIIFTFNLIPPTPQSNQIKYYLLMLIMLFFALSYESASHSNSQMEPSEPANQYGGVAQGGVDWIP